MGKWINSFRDLDVWQRSFELSMEIFTESQSFPFEERYSLTDQIRRSSRSVSANLAEAWAKRRYPAHWVSKLSDSQAEAMEIQNCCSMPGNVVTSLQTLRMRNYRITIDFSVQLKR